MKGLFRFLLLLFILSISSPLFAQDTLPKFSVRHIGNDRIIIGWVNPFPTIKQISIQRSHDSLINYKTILSVADPKAVQNGFADNKAPNDHMFYRIFYAMEGGAFYFTQAKRPLQDTANQTTSNRPTIPGDRNTDTANKANSKVPVVKKPSYVPSFYVYTNKDGYVYINLPDADLKKYSIKFFEEDNTPLFEIKPIKDRALTLDKANFMHAGWFHFELYNDDKLVERHKFYLSKDF